MIEFFLNSSFMSQRPVAQEEKMCKAHEQTILINTVGQCACGECSSVFKNVKSNKRPNKYKYLKRILCNFGKGVLK